MCVLPSLLAVRWPAALRAAASRLSALSATVLVRAGFVS